MAASIALGRGGKHFAVTILARQRRRGPRTVDTLLGRRDKCRDAGLTLAIGLSEIEQHADAPHALGRCARSSTGHPAAAALPTKPTNSRRLMSSP